MLNTMQNKALYPVLQHYTGYKISSIFKEGEDLIFKTLMGEIGIVSEDSFGDWNIVIGNELVHKIEGEIFNVLIQPSNKSSMEDYIQILNSFSNRSDVSERSKLLVSNILIFLNDYILGSDFLPKDSIQVGVFEVFNVNGMKFINCLN